MENSNRVYKFRAWDKKQNKMYDLEKCIGFEVSDFRNKRPQHKDLEVMQFTGLKDVNGKEIFEGDIVKWDDSNDSGYVSYMSETTEYVVDEWKEGDRKSKGHSLSSLGEVEIIGSIYENPELLKNK